MCNSVIISRLKALKKLNPYNDYYYIQWEDVQEIIDEFEEKSQSQN